MLYSFFFVLNVIISVALITIVLVHRGKGSEVGAAFSGATSSLSVFGAKGPDSFLIKLVSVLAFLFFVNAIAMIYVAGHDFSGDSVVEQFDVEQMRMAPEFGREADASDDDSSGDGTRDSHYTDDDMPRQEDGDQSVVPEVPN